MVFAVIAFYYSSHLYQFKEPLLQATDTSLQMTMKCLTHLQSFVRRQIQVEEITSDDELSQYEHICPKQRYTIRIIAQKPTIIYIEEFLTQKEMQHLIELT